MDLRKILFVLSLTPILSISWNISGPEPRQTSQSSPVALDTVLTNFSSTPVLFFYPGVEFTIRSLIEFPCTVVTNEVQYVRQLTPLCGWVVAEMAVVRIAFLPPKNKQKTKKQNKKGKQNKKIGPRETRR